MNSGIYKLTFSSGHFYIGKSGNMPRRWDDHWDNFAKNKAARNMQMAFNKFGYPNKEVLLECHQDHCDIMEAFLINKHRSSKMLNSASPICTITEDDYDILVGHPELLTASTVDHCRTIISQNFKINRSIREHTKNLALVEKEKEHTSNTLNAQIRELRNGTIIPKLELQIQQLTEDNKVLVDKLIKYETRNWWQRLFNK